MRIAMKYFLKPGWDARRGERKGRRDRPVTAGDSARGKKMGRPGPPPEVKPSGLGTRCFLGPPEEMITAKRRIQPNQKARDSSFDPIEWDRGNFRAHFKLSGRLLPANLKSAKAGSVGGKWRAAPGLGARVGWPRKSWRGARYRMESGFPTFFRTLRDLKRKSMVFHERDRGPSKGQILAFQKDSAVP